MDAGRDGAVDFAAEIVEQSGGVVGGVDEVADGADIFALDVAEDDASPVLGNGTVEVIGWARASEVEDGGSGFKAAAGNFGIVSFDGDQGAFLREGGENGKKRGDLLSGLDASGVMKRGFSSKIDKVGSFGTEAASPRNGSFGARDDAFAIPRVRAEVDDPHEVRLLGRAEGVTAKLKFSHLGGQGGGVLLGELGKRLKREHIK